MKIQQYIRPIQRVHLAILREPYLSLILEGIKLIESRFTMKRILPYERIREEDHIIFKLSGGLVMGSADVLRVEFYEHLPPGDVEILMRKHQTALQIDEDFIREKRQSQYISLIWLKNVARITPYVFEKHDQRTWLILAEA